MRKSHLILDCEYHSQRRLGGASTHPGMSILSQNRITYQVLILYLQGSMMTFGYSFNIWVPLLLFPTAGPDGAPRWRKGWPVTFVFYFLLWAGFVASILLYRRWVTHLWLQWNEWIHGLTVRYAVRGGRMLPRRQGRVTLMERLLLRKLVKIQRIAPEKGETFAIVIVVCIIKKMDSLQCWIWHSGT